LVGLTSRRTRAKLTPSTSGHIILTLHARRAQKVRHVQSMGSIKVSKFKLLLVSSRRLLPSLPTCRMIYLHSSVVNIRPISCLPRQVITHFEYSETSTVRW